MPNRYRIYFVSFLMDMVCAFVIGATAVYAIELGARALHLGLIGALGAGVYVLSSMSSGKLCDRFSRKAIVLAGSLAAVLSCLMLSRTSALPGLFIFYAGFHLGIGFFWPALQSILADSRHSRSLSATLGNFCIFWSLGFTFGHYLAGRLTELSATLPFVWCIYSTVVILLVSLTISSGEATAGSGSADFMNDSSGSRKKLWPRFLISGWLSNFTLVFTLSAAKMLFPKLALDVDNIGRTMLGIMLALLHAGQVFMFWLTKYWHGWQYNRRTYILTQLLALPGALLLALTSNPACYAAGMLLIGIGAGFTYTSSIYYSTSRPPGSATRTGFHEAFIGMGIMLGPLLGGFVSGPWGLHSPYILSGLLIMTAIAAQVWLLYRPSPGPSVPAGK